MLKSMGLSTIILDPLRAWVGLVVDKDHGKVNNKWFRRNEFKI